MASENKDEMASDAINKLKAFANGIADWGSDAINDFIDNMPSDSFDRFSLADLARVKAAYQELARSTNAPDSGSVNISHTERNAAVAFRRKLNQMRFSRPGAPDTFAVEDRFYFGKGRKER